MSSDRFYCCDLNTLVSWIFAEEKKGGIFGISRDLFFMPQADDPFRMRRYGKLLETPLGVAAGPHTQMSQNLVAAWLCGARYMELKTVQVLDELEVTKPCIDMADEGYNCEWSQELKLDQSFDEYLNAWIVLHLLRDRFGWGEGEDPGFIFNMSVGYNLEGIKSPTVQRFLDRMADCSSELEVKLKRLSAVYPRVMDLAIPAMMSDNVTISTMHGCPPDEVEKIGRYFIEERGLNTTIKLNPTLLGPDGVRGILNDSLGFTVEVPDLAFEHDLKYPDAVALIRSLTNSAAERRVAFNLKLTNTLETGNRLQNLPDNEAMVYMSGRALHPISVNLAARLQEEFAGGLDISFSAGVDCFNIARTIACGLKPVTVCSDLLKPGGYARLGQYLENLGDACRDAGVKNLEGFIKACGPDQADVNRAALANLKAYAVEVKHDERYKKEAYPFEGIKTDRDLPVFDCAQAPCMTECPAGQEIPRYLDYTARGEMAKARQTILATNPFPHVQGKVCDHLCQFKCTRMNYDDPLLIREIKRFAAGRSDDCPFTAPADDNGKSVAVIGAGPTGMSCAYFLRLAGFKVDVYEGKSFAGGMAADGIPAFRLDDGSLEKDLGLILSLGVNLHTGIAVDKALFEKLSREHDYVYLAVGAQKSMMPDMPNLDADGVMDQLGFLSRVRRGGAPELGGKVIIIGGGNSAMDAARTAARLVEPGGEVTICYRRTRAQMPAEDEEIEAALAEGVKLVELCAPEGVEAKGGRVTGLAVSRMELGAPDESGRPKPVKVPGSESVIPADTIIPAIGQRLDLDFLPGGRIEADPVSLETKTPGLFAGGDAVRGASSLINAIGDGRRAARAIIQKAGFQGAKGLSPEEDREPDWPGLMKKQARRVPAAALPELAPEKRMNFDLYVGTLDEASARQEAERCLQCDVFCNVCTTVCPNRANLYLENPGYEYPLQKAVMNGGKVEVETYGAARAAQHYQIINLADFCNECGNCATFCPTSGAPYQDKPRFHLSAESYRKSPRGYFFESRVKLVGKDEHGSFSLCKTDGGYEFESNVLKASLDSDFSASLVELKRPGTEPLNLRRAAEAAVLFELSVESPAGFLGRE